MAIIGPGSVQQSEIKPDATLTGASEYEYVRILNPLNDDFAIQVAQSRPVDLPFTINSDPRTSAVSKDENAVRQTYGIALKNPDHSSKKHILNQTVIKSGQTVNLTGDVAQVAVRQLVTEILQQRGQRVFLSDANKRKQVEDEIIVARGSMQDLMDNRLQDPRTVINDAIEKSNEVPHEETAFPGLSGSEDAGATATNDSDTVATGTTQSRKKTS